MKAINTYLSFIFAEGVKRKFKFDPEKIDQSLVDTNLKIPITKEQLCLEYNLLINKLLKRDPARAKALLNNKAIEPHPLFIVISGGVEKWEKLREK